MTVVSCCMLFATIFPVRRQPNSIGYKHSARADHDVGPAPGPRGTLGRYARSLDLLEARSTS